MILTKGVPSFFIDLFKCPQFSGKVFSRLAIKGHSHPEGDAKVNASRIETLTRWTNTLVVICNLFVTHLDGEAGEKENISSGANELTVSKQQLQENSKSAN